MKNIHVLPTENSSRLSYNKDGVLELHRLQWRKNTQNIYITSNEEIKKDEWCIDSNNIVFKFKKFMNYNYYKKIILTTDSDLIKDGVRKIDNDFLEWFVDNPTCEFIEVETEAMFKGYMTFPESINEPPFYGNLKHKIIIPKEEPKQELKVGDNTNFGIITDIKEHSVCFGKNKVGVDIWYKKSDVVLIPQEEPKQETLEEFAERLCPNKQVEYDMIIEGAKWQQERSYTEEEVLILLHERDVHNMHFPSTFNKGWKTPKEWFEQFKKK